MSALPPITDHAMMRLIRARVDAGYPMAYIAGEIGCDVSDLCDWIFAYKDPRPAKAYQNKGADALRGYDPGDKGGWNRGAQLRRHLNWERQREGARAALASGDK